MMIKSLAVLASAMLALSVASSSSAYAYTGSGISGGIIISESGKYDIAMSPVPDLMGAVEAAQSSLSQDYKSVSTDAVGGISYHETARGYLCYIDKDRYNAMNSIESACDLWLQEHMPQLVPQGTPVLQVPGVCAQAVADMMTYDRDALSDQELLLSYQCALPCFRDGTGVCATYAFAFDAMVSYAPYDPSTGLVDYAAGDQAHLTTAYVRNQTHAWSAVMLPDGWHYYDVCFYDGAHDPMYLDYAGGIWDDGRHDSAVMITAVQ